MFRQFSLNVVAATVAMSGIALTSTQASAVSLSVQLACASDYYSYCSKQDPDGPGVRSCMRANGPKLSKSCIKALIDAGEVSKDEVERRTAGTK